MTRKKDRSFQHQPIALQAVSGLMGVPTNDLALAALDPRGLFYLHKQNKGALVAFFRPTGITYEDRPQTIEKLSRKSGKGGKCSYRFSLERRERGPGAGGLEIYAHKVAAQHRPTSRLNMLVTEEWDVLHVGSQIGSVGWFPRELTPVYRPLLYHYPYAITHYALKPDVEAPQNLRPNIYLCFVMWNLGSEKVNFHSRELRDSYDLLWGRTHLFRWNTAQMEEAWVIPHGYGGEIVME